MNVTLLILLGVGIGIILTLLRRRLAEFYGQKPEDYEDSFPLFDLKKHLNGDMVCDGVIFGPLGRVTSSFVADFMITWDDDVGTMDEVFRYNDGSIQKRQWIITLGDGAHFSTTADDVPKGGKGTIAGPAVLMEYAIKLPEASGGHTLSTIDWMYLTTDGTIVNRSQFRKFGLKVAELVATIRPRGTQ